MSFMEIDRITVDALLQHLSIIYVCMVISITPTLSMSTWKILPYFLVYPESNSCSFKTSRSDIPL